MKRRSISECRRTVWASTMTMYNSVDLVGFTLEFGP